MKIQLDMILIFILGTNILSLWAKNIVQKVTQGVDASSSISCRTCTPSGLCKTQRKNLVPQGKRGKNFLLGNSQPVLWLELEGRFRFNVTG